jgi:hypothetical protein
MESVLEGRADMKKISFALILAVAAGATAIGDAGIGSKAFAQSGGSSSYMKSSPGSPDRTVPQAPIGHRQPRAGDVPSEKNLANPNDPVNKEDAVLDRKIKSICRGC